MSKVWYSEYIKSKSGLCVIHFIFWPNILFWEIGAVVVARNSHDSH